MSEAAVPPIDLDDLAGREHGRKAGLSRSYHNRLKVIAVLIFVTACGVGAAVSQPASSGAKNSGFNWLPAAGMASLVILVGILLMIQASLQYRRRIAHLSADVTRSLGHVEPPVGRAEGFFAKGRLSPAGETPSLAGEEDLDPNHPPTTSEF